jgi:hypothetical protein
MSTGTVSNSMVYITSSSTGTVSYLKSTMGTWTNSASTVDYDSTDSTWVPVPVRLNLARARARPFDLVEGMPRPKIRVKNGTDCRIELPDGSVVEVDVNGNFKVNDKDAKVTYVGRRFRDRNAFLNSSDLVADFLDDLRKAGARAEQALDVPLEVFINWLVIKCAEADGDPVPEGVLPPAQHPKALPPPAPPAPRCLCCGRFVRKSHPAPFCGGIHMDAYMARR